MTETSVIGPPADPARWLDLPVFGGLLPCDWDCRHCWHALDVDV